MKGPWIGLAVAAALAGCAVWIGFEPFESIAFGTAVAALWLAWDARNDG